MAPRPAVCRAPCGPPSSSIVDEACLLRLPVPIRAPRTFFLIQRLKQFSYTVTLFHPRQKKTFFTAKKKIQIRIVILIPSVIHAQRDPCRRRRAVGHTTGQARIYKPTIDPPDAGVQLLVYDEHSRR